MPTCTRWPGEDGYERMEFARGRGWRPIPSWGLNGWDLGSWPLVVIYHRGETELAVDVEGDVTIETLAGVDARDRRTDETAFFYWRQDEEPWVEGLDSHKRMPAELRGPFSRARQSPQGSVEAD